MTKNCIFEQLSKLDWSQVFSVDKYSRHIYICSPWTFTAFVLRIYSLNVAGDSADWLGLTSVFCQSGVRNKAERTEGVSVRMHAKNENNNGDVHGSDCRYENINI